MEKHGFYLEQQVRPPPKPPAPPTITQSISSRDLKYENLLLKKYKLEGEYYHSITPSSMFENMISCIPGGGCFKALDIWKTTHFVQAREIDDRIRKEYRKSSGGHSGYTFHSLSRDEMYIFCNCLKNAI
jgi:hypothetical protein